MQHAEGTDHRVLLRMQDGLDFALDGLEDGARHWMRTVKNGGCSSGEESWVAALFDVIPRLGFEIRARDPRHLQHLHDPVQ